jgi:MFS family permease
MPRWLGPRLSLMFFLDIGVTAAYFPLLSVHLTKSLGFAPREVGLVFAMLPLATLIAPVIVASVADRLLPAERAAAIVNVARALSLLVFSQAQTFPEVLVSVFLVGLSTAPSSVLDFTIAFHHLRDDPHGIGRTRVFGTLGWIAVLWLGSAYFERFAGVTEQIERTRSLLQFGAGLALLSAVYALTLPHTPPARSPTRVFAFLDAARLLEHRAFRAVVIAATIGAACTQFHFVLHPLFYSDGVTGLGLDLAATSRASSVAQFLEVGLFPFLGAAVARLGMRKVLALGMLAWPIRYIAYALGGPALFVIGMQTLHGVTVVFGQIASQVAVDRLAPADARASSQALLSATASGAGSLIGQLLCGLLLEANALPGGGHRWPWVFAFPLALGIVGWFVVARGVRPDAPTRVL